MLFFVFENFFFLLGRFEVGVGGFMFVVAASFGNERQ